MDAVIIGAGAQGRIVADILYARGEYESIQFVDDDPALLGRTIAGVPVVGNCESLRERDPLTYGVVIALGAPPARVRVAEGLRRDGVPFMNAVHPATVVMVSVRMGTGIMIHPGAIINTGTELSDLVLVNTAAVIEHDCLVGEGATIASGVQIGGRVNVGNGAFVCAGAIVLGRRNIGPGAIVAAGAVVTHDVPAHTIVMGGPARKTGEVGPDYDWRRLL